MRPSYAILLDGGFVRRKLARARTPATARDIVALVERIKGADALAGFRLHRVYYYDAHPFAEARDVPLGGGIRDFGASDAAQRSNQLHRELGEAAFVAMRFGELHVQGWRLEASALNRQPGPTLTVTAAHLQPHFQQKGVDMRIGLDIASLTLKKHVTVIVLVTADSDFVPAMKFARREGAQLFLVPLRHGVYGEMLVQSDVLLDIDPRP